MMIGALSWFARRKVAANILMWLIVLGGLLSLKGIRTQFIPDFSYDLITISIPYPGATPEEVDELVCALIHRSLDDLKVTRKVHSVATEGLCYARVSLVRGTRANLALQDVQARIDAIDSFPEDAEIPVIQEYSPPDRNISVIISGKADEKTLVHLAERFQDELTTLPGVTLATLSGARPYEVSVEIPEESLRRFGLTMSDIAAAIQRSSLQIPAGSVKGKSGEILLRSSGRKIHRREIEDIVVSQGDGSARLTVGQIGKVQDGFTEYVERLLFDGNPAIMIDVFRVGDQDIRRVSDQVRTYFETVTPSLPPGIQVNFWDDMSRHVRSRLETMMDNGWSGLVLVLIVLALSLQPRLAAWVALGIPISFLGTLWAMRALGQTVNMMSLMGFIVVLGILVDDAIIVGENIYRHRQLGKRGPTAAVAGVTEVAKPIFFAVLTTVVAFSPMLWLTGFIGQQFKVLASVAILCLAFSVGESLLILPAHLSHSRRASVVPEGTVSGPSLWRRSRNVFSVKVARLYRRSLDWTLTWPFISLSTAVSICLLSMGLVIGGFVRFQFYEPVAGDYVEVGVAMPQGTPEEATLATLTRVRESAEGLRQHYTEEGVPDIFRHTLTIVGKAPRGSLSFSDPGLFRMVGSHLGSVRIELAPNDQRAVRVNDFVAQLRPLVDPIPDAKLIFNASVLEVGKAIDIELRGPDLEVLQRATAELEEALARYPGVYGVRNTLEVGKREVRISVTREAESLGIDMESLSRQIRQAFHGQEAQRLQRGRHELKVMIRYPESDRRSLADLEEMRIRAPNGADVPLAVVGRLRLGRGVAVIHRTDGHKTVRVSADVDSAVTESGGILGELRRSVLSELVSAHTGLSYSFVGEQEVQRETLSDLLRATLVALFSIYAFLAIASSSYLQPLLIMVAIPVASAGAIWGHAIMSRSLTVWSLLGLMALAGVVVNDGLILLDVANRAWRSGVPRGEAIRRAGEERLRPVFLTSLTTFAGLLPMLLEQSPQAQILIPVAISLAFGVLTAPLASLFLIPVGFSLLPTARGPGIDEKA